MRKLLLIDDDERLAEPLRQYFAKFDMSLENKTHPLKAIEHLKKHDYDLIVLDVMLPEIDGFETCRRIRQFSEIPIVMLTARGEVMDRVVGLEVGADDYVTKPFSIRELLARVKAIFRRVEELTQGAEAHTPGIFEAGNLVIDPDKRSATLKGRNIDLTAKEFDLLLHFAHNPGRVYTRSQLLDAVWGYGHDGYEHTVNSHINRLRGKIEKDPAHPLYILTVWGVGYKFAELEDLKG